MDQGGQVKRSADAKNPMKPKAVGNKASVDADVTEGKLPRLHDSLIEQLPTWNPISHR
jgi:hypothetical protein